MKLTIKKAAELMNKSQQFIRIGLQNGTLPIGSAVKTGEKNYNYYISPKLFEEFTGIKVEIEGEKI